MENLLNIDAQTILDSMGDGVYVTDPGRRILYWNKSAERITGWLAEDIVGGDYYGVRQLNADQYGFFLADVMGHGLAAALYTMHLSALWDRYHPLLETPAAFAVKIGNELNRIVKDGEAFAAGIGGLVDLGRHEVVFAGSGNPPALLIRSSGEFEQLQCSGFLFGVMEDAPYDVVRADVHPGDRLLLFSDGATEIHNADGQLLGVDGLIAIRLKDDLTLMEIHIAG